MTMYKSPGTMDNSLLMGKLLFEIICFGSTRTHSKWIPNRQLNKSKETTKITCIEVTAGISAALQHALDSLCSGSGNPDTRFVMDYRSCRYEVKLEDSRDCLRVCVSVYCIDEYMIIGGIELC